MFMEIQMQAALSDGELMPQYMDVDWHIAQELVKVVEQLDELSKAWAGEYRSYQTSNGNKTLSPMLSVAWHTQEAYEPRVKRAYR